MEEIETRTVAKVSRRLVPFLILCYFVAYLDRVNVGFAKLQMNGALGLNDATYSVGAGVFFFTYFLLEVPSNLALERFGARRWIARIMLSWGIISGAMAFIPQIAAATGLRPDWTFYGVRLLLGAAEAGFFPGIIFYLTLWFPAVYRARIVGLFMAAIPLSSLIGAPISGALLGVQGAGLDGWQWLFIIEALPALVLSVFVLRYLTDKPADAAWLADDERAWLAGRLAAEERQRHAVERIGIAQALTDSRVLVLGLVYFGAVAGNYGVGYFLPTIVKGFGLTNLQTGFVVAIPYLLGTAGMVWYGRRSDRTMERKGHAAVALGLGVIGIGGAAFFSDPLPRMALLSLGSLGIFAVLPVFWTLPTAFLSGASAAAGIAIINALGNLSGFAGPTVMGYLKEQTGNFRAGLICIAAMIAIALAAVLTLRHNRQLERAPVQHAPAE
jgi:MFS family permease